MYFKRFFATVSLVEEDPKSLMIAALFLAGKVEEERIDIRDLLPKYSPPTRTRNRNRNISAHGMQAQDVLAIRR